MQGKEYVIFLLEEKDKIEEFVAEISGEMQEYIEEKKDSKFVLFYKYLTHSDLATFGKATKVNSLDKNLLYYIDTNEINRI